MKYEISKNIYLVVNKHTAPFHFCPFKMYLQNKYLQPVVPNRSIQRVFLTCICVCICRHVFSNSSSVCVSKCIFQNGMTCYGALSVVLSCCGASTQSFIVTPFGFKRAKDSGSTSCISVNVMLGPTFTVQAKTAFLK